MRIRFKRLSETAKQPTRGTDGSAGLDLYVSRCGFENGLFVCHSDIALEIPRGYVGLLFPRSSVCSTNLRMANCVGVIDSDYRGEISARFDCYSSNSKNYQVGDRFAQIVIMPFEVIDLEQAEELTKTKRGAGGYGSTN